jgi:hypothetical protein
MPTPRETTAGTLPPLVERVRRRLVFAHGLESIAVAAPVGAGVAMALRASGASPLTCLLAAAITSAAAIAGWMLLRRRDRSVAAAAQAVERALPECQNVVITAAELAIHPDRARPWIRERVFADAERVAAGIGPAAIVALRSRMAWCAVILAAASLAIWSGPRRAATVIVQTIERAVGVSPLRGSSRIVITLQPPAHTKLPQATLTDPERISAVEGTRLQLRMEGNAAALTVRFGAARLDLRADGTASVADLTLQQSGYLAVESDASARLIPVSVTPDRAPTIKVERPGRDLLLPSAGAGVPVETSATDDFGLQLLALRYTKVSGSGEQFEFVEGDLPLTVSRSDARAWHGRGELPLARLGLEPGDSLVYRVVARDARPGDSGLATSDTFFVEIAGPGQVALEGFEMPPDRERYALSQQMIVLKTQRLRAREAGLSRQALQEQTAAIGGEQRAVRANFVFLMGGHVEDEEAEAEHSHEIQEGRLENTARREMSVAVSHMGQTEQALAAVDTATALAQARLAVEALQRAFGRNRYILRTLPVRSRVDPTRRLTGKLDEAKAWNRGRPEPSADRRADAIRQLVAELMRLPAGRVTQDEAARLAEAALAIDPASREWQQIAVALLARNLDRARSLALAEARRLATRAAALPGSMGTLPGAWAAEVRGR